MNIRENEIDIQSGDKIFTINNDFVFAMTGYHPDFKFLKGIGIDISGDGKMLPSFSSDNYETNMERIFLAGVVCGGMDTGKLFIENSREHAEKIFNYINQKYFKDKKLAS